MFKFKSIFNSYCWRKAQKFGKCKRLTSLRKRLYFSYFQQFVNKNIFWYNWLKLSKTHSRHFSLYSRMRLILLNLPRWRILSSIWINIVSIIMSLRLLLERQQHSMLEVFFSMRRLCRWSNKLHKMWHHKW